MKILITLILLLSFYSCSQNTFIHPISTKWVFKGINYKAATTIYDDDELAGEDSIENSINIEFMKKPTTDKIYQVVSYFSYPDSIDNDCSIRIHDPKMGIGGYYSIGKAGQKVNIKINNGKIVASFIDISMRCFDTTIKTVDTVSGTLIEQ